MKQVDLEVDATVTLILNWMPVRCLPKQAFMRCPAFMISTTSQYCNELTHKHSFLKNMNLCVV